MSTISRSSLRLMPKLDSPVQVNPRAGCPADILAQQVAVEVAYIDMAGKRQTGTIEINRAVADDIRIFFETALELGFPIEKVVRASEYGWDDPAMMAANVTSGFNYRNIPGQPTISNHAHGLALDVNTRLNPYIVYGERGATVYPAGASWNPGVPGTLHKDHPLVLLMKDKGWVWGGDWVSDVDHAIDYQHFEKPLAP